MPVRIIAAGIDSLYASARGTVRPDLLATALERRTAAAEAGEPAMWSLDAIEETFLVRPHGTRCFPVWATSGAMDVWLGDRPPFPAVHLRLFSRFIHRVGIEQAVATAERLVGVLVPPRALKVPGASVLRPEVEVAPCGPSLSVSRVDVYADTQGWEPRRDDYSRFVGRAAHRRQWEDRAHPIHMLGDVLTGFTFGQRDIVGRVYDKGREHAKRGENWLKVIWDDRDPRQPVWHGRCAALQGDSSVASSTSAAVVAPSR